jgi:O-antigen/teichoic acid export membrane protein
LIGGLLAGRILASVAFIRMLGIRRPPPARDLKAAISRHRRFLWLSTPAQFANSVGLYVAPLLIAREFSARQAGYFALANQSLAVPISFVGVGLAQAYVASASRSAKQDTGALLALFRRTVKRLAAVGVAAIIPLAVLAPTMFALVFGDLWREAGVYAQILAPMFFCQLISSPVSQSLNLVGRQHHQLAWDVSRSVGVVAAFFLAQLNGASARGTVAAYSATMALFYLTHLAMSSRALRARRSDPQQPTER